MITQKYQAKSRTTVVNKDFLKQLYDEVIVLKSKLKEAEDFIAELKHQDSYVSGNNLVSRVLSYNSNARELWIKCRLDKYPGDY